MSSPTPAITLRPLTRADAPALAQAVQDSLASLSVWLPWADEHYGLQQALEWVDHTHQGFEQKTAFHFGLFDAQGHFLGKVSLDQISLWDRRANLGYWVNQRYQRQGVALQGVKAIVEYGLQTAALNRLEVVIAERNLASRALAEKAGAHFEGVARRRMVIPEGVVDAWIYSFT